MMDFKWVCSLLGSVALISSFGIPIASVEAAEVSNNEAIANQPAAEPTSTRAQDLLAQHNNDSSNVDLDVDSIELTTPEDTASEGVQPAPEVLPPDVMPEAATPGTFMPDLTESPRTTRQPLPETTSPTSLTPRPTTPDDVVPGNEDDAVSDPDAVKQQTPAQPGSRTPSQTPAPGNIPPSRTPSTQGPSTPPGTVPPPEGGIPSNTIEDRTPETNPEIIRPNESLDDQTDDSLDDAIDEDESLDDAPDETLEDEPDIDAPRLEPGRATRSGPSYIGAGGNIGIGEGDTALGDSSFAVFSKIGLTRFVSVRPAVLIEENPTILLPVTIDFIPAVTDITEDISGEFGIRVSPFLGAGIAISTGDDGAVDFLATGGVDVPITRRLSATAAINATLFDNPAVGLLLGLGVNF